MNKKADKDKRSHFWFSFFFLTDDSGNVPPFPSGCISCLKFYGDLPILSPLLSPKRSRNQNFTMLYFKLIFFFPLGLWNQGISRFLLFCQSSNKLLKKLHHKQEFSDACKSSISCLQTGTRISKQILTLSFFFSFLLSLPQEFLEKMLSRILSEEKMIQSCKD